MQLFEVGGDTQFLSGVYYRATVSDIFYEFLETKISNSFKKK